MEGVVYWSEDPGPALCPATNCPGNLGQVTPLSGPGSSSAPWAQLEDPCDLAAQMFPACPSWLALVLELDQPRGQRGPKGSRLPSSTPRSCGKLAQDTPDGMAAPRRRTWTLAWVSLKSLCSFCHTPPLPHQGRAACPSVWLLALPGAVGLLGRSGIRLPAVSSLVKQGDSVFLVPCHSIKKAQSKGGVPPTTAY